MVEYILSLGFTLIIIKNIDKITFISAIGNNVILLKNITARFKL